MSPGKRPLCSCFRGGILTGHEAVELKLECYVLEDVWLRLQFLRRDLGAGFDSHAQGSLSRVSAEMIIWYPVGSWRRILLFRGMWFLRRMARDRRQAREQQHRKQDFGQDMKRDESKKSRWTSQDKNEK